MEGIIILDHWVCFARGLGTGDDKIVYVVGVVEEMLLVLEVICV